MMSLKELASSSSPDNPCNHTARLLSSIMQRIVSEVPR
jgi:hypothetical protein